MSGSFLYESAAGGQSSEHDCINILSAEEKHNIKIASSLRFAVFVRKEIYFTEVVTIKRLRELLVAPRMHKQFDSALGLFTFFQRAACTTSK